MQNIVVFVTGANKGLGLETSRQIAKEGHHVIMGSRDINKGTEEVNKLLEEGYVVEPVEIDLTVPESVDKAVNHISEKYGKLDVLINNAGAAVGEGWLGNSVESIAMDDLKKTFDINFFSTIDLTRKLLPLIRKGVEAKIINVSSILGSLKMHDDEDSPIYESKPFAYNSSKTALNQLTVHLAHLLKKENIKVYSAHPGWVKTDMGGSNAPLSVEEGAKTMVDLALDKVDFPSGSFVHLNATLPW